ncbi:MAG: dihydroorotase [Bacteroidota bacterium]|nr:dihydroorotase [Bacteroidota bacterium]
MKRVLYKEARLINRGQIIETDLLVVNDRIERIDSSISVKGIVDEIAVDEVYLMPGVIDDQVHFREPGLTHKATIFSESRAGVAGGVTSFMEMPNTKPAALTQQLLEDKYKIASTNAWANYSFFMGAGNDNLDEVLKTDPQNVCGVKVFMGSSTGNMLVDNRETLERLFSQCQSLIATHCEDEATIIANLAEAQSTYGDHIPPSAHPAIRSREACYLSSSIAVELAKKYNTRLHILHISTLEEVALFEKGPIGNKRITSEACVHHMYFSEQDYITLGNQIKCNPAIKTLADQKAILQAVLDDRIDIIASDHAPHTWDEKSQPYNQSPSGLPLIQHELQMMLTHWRDGLIGLEKIIEKMCHAPADCFRVVDRGYLDEGYYADIVMLDTKKETYVSKENILYQCGWSPLEGIHLPGVIAGTWVNGILCFAAGSVVGVPTGRRLSFNA